MKKIISLFVSVLFVQIVAAQKEPVVMEINGKPVTKSEFLQIYLKNNNDPKFDKQTLDDYVEMFKKFKLKVAEAETLGYDTIPKLKKELEGYKKQLATPYLIDSVENRYLVEQAYERIKTEVRASHILVRVDANASPKDTLAAYNRIIALKKRIEKGEDFATVAKMKSGSDDPSAVNNGGDLGFFTAFQMVYAFEEKAYTTPIGSISEPFRTRFGYHILKVTDKRPARGTIKTAHLMVAVPKDATQEVKDNAEKKINELYEKLSKGEKWEDLVALHSDDPSSSKKGGELAAFGSGTTQRMVPSFEDAAFALKADGEISKPIRTDYGFHIVKRLEWKDVAAYPAMKKELQGRVNKDERSKKTQDSFVAKLKTNYGYKYSGDKSLKWFVSNLDSTYYIGKWNAENLKSNKTLFKLNGTAFTQKSFADYLVKNYRGIKRDESKTVVKAQYKAWEKAEILNYEEQLLPAKYPDFKALVNEYHDGIILYEIMSDKVWNKAVKDTTGLKDFFSKNRSNYMWPKRLDATVYECLNKDIAVKVAGMLKNDTINSKDVLDVVNKDSELNLKVRMNKFDLEQTNFLKDRTFNKGVNPAFEFEGKMYVVKVNEVLSPMPKEFNEAKGIATSDYQTYLEKTWLDELKAKYPIKINNEVLYNLGNK
jgi:peptidyl-prolyl cis-trans isomerase SurA